MKKSKSYICTVYQFPIGKGKIELPLNNGIILISYQFPIGKGKNKGIVEWLDCDLSYQFPIGKGKIVDGVIAFFCFEVSIPNRER